MDWATPDSGDQTITGYRIAYGEPGSSDEDKDYTDTVTGNSVVIGSLTPGTTYELKGEDRRGPAARHDVERSGPGDSGNHASSTHADADTYTDGYPDADTDADTGADGHPDADAAPDGYPDARADPDADARALADADPDAGADADTRADGHPDA